MPERFKAPRGTFDVLPEQAAGARAAIQRVARGECSRRAGYGRIETPVFEDTDLFARGVGESTDIVQKQMFTFEDQGGAVAHPAPGGDGARSAAPTSSTACRRCAQPVKLWTDGPFFRHERPQAGRYRQFTQVDAEAIGSDSPLVDAEMIVLRERHPHRARRPGRTPAARQPRHPGHAQRLPRRAPRLPALPRGRALRGGPRAGSTSTRCAPSTPTTRGPAR